MLHNVTHITVYPTTFSRTWQLKKILNIFALPALKLTKVVSQIWKAE